MSMNMLMRGTWAEEDSKKLNGENCVCGRKHNGAFSWCA